MDRPRPRGGDFVANPLRGQRALVTGASSGIGEATARELARAGCAVVVLGRDEQRLEAVATEIDAQVVVADLGDPTGLRTALAACADSDLLVLNAGVGWAGDFLNMPGERIAELMDVNLTAPIQLAHAALPQMLRRRRGHLVFVSSIASVGVADEEVYSASKAGLRVFAASLRHRIQPHGVHVTTVLPGAVHTPFFRTRGRDYERTFPRLRTPEHVAGALVRGVRRRADEVFVPRWLSVAARVQGALPGTFSWFSRRSRS